MNLTLFAFMQTLQILLDVRGNHNNLDYLSKLNKKLFLKSQEMDLHVNNGITWHLEKKKSDK